MWMLPGAFWHFDVYENIIHTIKPAIFYDGVNNCSWNGGRSNIQSNVWNDDIVERYYKYNHRLAMTFSNANIDILDDVGNNLLEKMSERDNYIILRNEELRKYIRQKYPNLHLVYSIVGTKQEYDREFYSALLNKYDYIVPRYHHIKYIINDFPSVLDKFEIMINHTCPSNCPYWSKHYAHIDYENRTGVLYQKYDNESINCLIDEKITDDRLSEKNIKERFFQTLRNGFSRFKLAGREFPKERLYKEVMTIKDFI